MSCIASVVLPTYTASGHCSMSDKVTAVYRQCGVVPELYVFFYKLRSVRTWALGASGKWTE